VNTYHVPYLPKEDCLAPIATLGDVMRQTWDYDAGQSSHIEDDSTGGGMGIMSRYFPIFRVRGRASWLFRRFKGRANQFGGRFQSFLRNSLDAF